jgi:outer membrane protein assembly factor BamA
LRSVYWHAGYTDVDFAGSPVLDTAHALASYKLQVTPGPLYHLRSMKFENLDSAQETKAREMLGLKTGEVYDAMAVSNLNRKLLDPSSPLRGYGFSYTPKEDKQNQVVDLILTFYKP